MNENPLKATLNFHSYGYDNLKIVVVKFQGLFFTYLDRPCMDFVTQASGYTILRKREIKIALLKMISTLC